MSLIQPRVLKGFRDQLPKLAIPRHAMLAAITKVFTRHGYVPIETPALEYADILLGKGGAESDKQLYRFEDQGGRDIALRFDLTVPLARFAAMHINELGTPFRRYHIAPVWRAEKPQRGRYREFTQCDFDIIGSMSALSDAEILAVIHAIFAELGIDHSIRVNHRQILNGFLAVCGAEGRETAILRIIDKLEKLGKDAVAGELQNAVGLTAQQSQSVFTFLELSNRHQQSSILLDEAAKLTAGSDAAQEGIGRLRDICRVLEETIDPRRYRIDLSIARGLDYYTGVVFETQSTDLPDIGSICSGGRYDDLAGLYSKRAIPGVGASVGLDRTLAVLEELGRIPDRNSTAEILLTLIEPGSEGRIMGLAKQLRAGGIAAELYPDCGKLGSQLKYADRAGIRWVIIAGGAELQNESISVKDLSTGEQHDGIPLAEAAERLRSMLHG